MQNQSIKLERQTLEFVQDVEVLDEQEAVAQAFQRFAHQLGMRTACCLKLPDLGEDIADNFMMNTIPPSFVEQYIERNYVKRDPMVVELVRTFHPYTWSDVLARRQLSKEEIAIVESGRDFEMNVGLVVPIYGAAGYSGLMSITSDRDVLVRDVRAALHLSSIYVHNKLLALRRRDERNRQLLTPRETECLRWAACGKSDWDIGEILKISEKTVNYHLENAKRKYGVATRVQAIVAAIRQGVLAPS